VAYNLAIAPLVAMFEDMCEKVRRLSALFLALALIMAGVGQGVQASDMAAKMMATTAASDMSMPGGCGGCSGDDQGMPMACFAVCVGSVFAILPATPAIAAAGLVSPPARPIVVIAGHHGPPDPYPPRPTILG